MPRYFFHVHDGTEFPDNDGTELPDLETARTQAVRFAGEMITHMGPAFWDQHQESMWTLEVADQGGAILARLRFSGERLN